MNKHYLSLLSFVTLLCMIILGTLSCKKNGASNEVPSPDDADFFIDADFLPESETNGKVAPRLMLNFNDEAVMIELRRPSDSDPMEAVLFLYPDNQAAMMCGNDTMLFCTKYNIETHEPSNDVLLVTMMGDDALLLTQCVMNWSNNTMTTGDKMVLPIAESSKNYGKRDDFDRKIRLLFFDCLYKPIAEAMEKIEQFCGAYGIPQGIVVSYMRTILMTQTANILFSDDPEAFADAMSYAVTMGTGQIVQMGLLQIVPRPFRDMASRLVSALGWCHSGGHGSVNAGGTAVTNDPPMESFFGKGRRVVETAGQMGTLDPIFEVYMNTSNITENSIYVKGRIVYGINHIMPVEMGYVYRLSGGPENVVADMEFHGKIISGLQKATKYTVYAYAKTLGDIVKSPEVTFWTLGFEAFPTSLEFPADGDSKSVGLSYSEDDITGWDITSKPSWCSINKDSERMFTVTADKTTEPRSGSIMVTGHSKALGSITQNIAVTQSGANSWDGTSWSFSGTITSSGVAGTSQIPIKNSILVVNNVANNDVSFDLAPALTQVATGYSDNYSLDANGNLIYTSYATMGYGYGTNATINCHVTFVRTSATTATADVNIRESLPGGYYQSFTGLLHGTLTNSNKMSDNHTIINLINSITDNINQVK